MATERSGPVFVVQFPHPGPEYNPKNSQRMAWNTEAHARKFLRSPGRYRDQDGVLREGDLVFWGEWEPPSRVVERWPRAGKLPRFLHEPVWGSPGRTRPRQNTDPWVFGDAFLYSNCK
jgi:hypothetical protein